MVTTPRWTGIFINNCYYRKEEIGQQEVKITSGFFIFNQQEVQVEETTGQQATCVNGQNLHRHAHILNNVCILNKAQSIFIDIYLCLLECTTCHCCYGYYQLNSQLNTMFWEMSNLRTNVLGMFIYVVYVLETSAPPVTTTSQNLIQRWIIY